MLSDEEKKAIEIVKGITEDDLLNYWEGPEEPYNAIQTILNLIEKQSKEIEEMFAENQSLKYTNGNMIHKDVVKVNYTPNDKIKAKIEELKQKKYILSSRESEIEILQSLLEKE